MSELGTTVLWRLASPRGEASHAAVLPGGPPYTLAFFVAGHLDRVENYDTVDMALYRANEVKQSLLDENWRED